MECPTKSGEGPELFIAYAARTLPRATEVVVERHLAGCPECRRIAEEQKLVWTTLDMWEPQFISSDFDRKLYARIAAEEQRPWYQRIFDLQWSLKPALPIAGACAIVLAAYLLREPAATWNPPVQTSAYDHVDIEQVERALDDIDMLKQLGVVVPPTQASQLEPM